MMVAKVDEQPLSLQGQTIARQFLVRERDRKVAFLDMSPGGRRVLIHAHEGASSRQPVTFVHGADDLLLPFVRAATAATPGAPLKIVRGGHLDGARTAGWRTPFDAFDGHR